VNRELNLLSRWSLLSVSSELLTTDQSKLSIQGNFYLTNLSYSKLSHSLSSFTETRGLTSSIETQVNLVRWYRWLYKYNLLHRSLLTAANQINTVQKLLGTGFYDSTFQSRNI
jgi:hypothetical protein